MRRIGLTLAIGWLLMNTTMAGEASKTPVACTEVQTCGSENCCGRCGYAGACEKYCRVVCEMKDVKKTVWVVKCSEFCMTMPNCGRGCGCGDHDCQECKGAEVCKTESACPDGGCKKCDPCASEKNKNFIPPKCGKIREKKTLEKKEVVCKAPSYKCVVVYCCPKCGTQESSSPKAAPSSPTPVKPAIPPAPPSPTKTTQDASLPSMVGT
jgi:hypothetical protein